MIILSFLLSLLTVVFSVVLTLVITALYIGVIVFAVAFAIAIAVGIYLLIYLIANVRFKKVPEAKYSVKNIAVHLILSAVTLGYYTAYRQAMIMKNMRRLTGKDENCIFEFVCFNIVPFYSIYWWIINSNIIKERFAEKGISTVSNCWMNVLLAIFTDSSTLPQVLMQHDFNTLDEMSEQDA